MEKFQLNDNRFPPYECVFIAAKGAPLGVLLYLKLWDRRNDSNKLEIRFSDIKEDYLMTKTLFENRLIEVAREGLLSFVKTPTRFQIELLDPAEELEAC